MKFILALTAIVSLATALPQQKRAPLADCPLDLQGSFVAPYLIIPINSADPNRAYGTQFTANITSTLSTLFAFDVPTSLNGKTCSLNLLFPNTGEVYATTGDGIVRDALLVSQINQQTTYNNRPAVKVDHGTRTISKGHGYNLATFSCTNLGQLAYRLWSDTGKFSTSWFEDNGKSGNQPVGLYIRAC